MNTFIRKVDAERSILSIVNNSTRGKKQLTGLSVAAISNWCLSFSLSNDHDLPKSLFLLSDLCNSLSDRSNENFDKIPIVFGTLIA